MPPSSGWTQKPIPLLSATVHVCILSFFLSFFFSLLSFFFPLSSVCSYAFICPLCSFALSLFCALLYSFLAFVDVSHSGNVHIVLIWIYNPQFILQSTNLFLLCITTKPTHWICVCYYSILNIEAGTYLRNVGKLLLGYTASHPRRWQFGASPHFSCPVYCNEPIPFDSVLQLWFRFLNTVSCHSNQRAHC